MTCRHVAQVRDVYLDGELSPSLTAEVHAHLLQCPACQEQIEMFRACSEVVAKDHPEPKLDSGFADRVVASLPKSYSVTGGSGLQTRRSLRQRFWRLAIGSSVPAAAAVLFFAVLIWPPGPHGDVAGVSVQAPTDAVESVVTPTLDAVEETQDAVKSITTLQGILVDEAQKNVSDARHFVDEGEGADGPEVTLLDVLLQPFRDVLEPIKEPDTESPDEEKIIRF